MAFPELSDPLRDSWLPYIIALIVGIITCIKNYMAGQHCPSKQRIDGKTVIVTGASSGIGYETALELARRVVPGGKLILACRDAEAAKRTAIAIQQKVKGACVEAKFLNLSSLKSVRQFVQELDVRSVDILINNAGIAFYPYEKSEEGFEMHFVSNYLGHFYLTHLLLPKLKVSQAARVINVTAQAHHASNIHLDDLNLSSSYAPREAFAQSKLALILMAHHMAKLLKDTNIKVYAVHPGLVRGTKHMRHSPFNKSYMMKLSMWPWMWLFMKSPEEGAQTSVYAAVAPELSQYSGKYFGDCQMQEPSENAKNDALAESLYEKSCDLVGI